MKNKIWIMAAVMIVAVGYVMAQGLNLVPKGTQVTITSKYGSLTEAQIQSASDLAEYKALAQPLMQDISRHVTECYSKQDLVCLQAIDDAANADYTPTTTTLENPCGKGQTPCQGAEGIVCCSATEVCKIGVGCQKGL